MDTSIKGKNLLTEGANFFLSEQFLKASKITFTTFGELPCVILFLLRTCVHSVMGTTPMLLQYRKTGSRHAVTEKLLTRT